MTQDPKLHVEVEERKDTKKQLWQRPQIEKLYISLDTMNRPGSGTDFMSLGSGTV